MFNILPPFHRKGAIKHLPSLLMRAACFCSPSLIFGKAEIYNLGRLNLQPASLFQLETDSRVPAWVIETRFIVNWPVCLYKSLVSVSFTLLHVCYTLCNAFLKETYTLSSPSHWFSSGHLNLMACRLSIHCHICLSQRFSHLGLSGYQQAGSPLL